VPLLMARVDAACQPRGSTGLSVRSLFTGRLVKNFPREDWTKEMLPKQAALQVEGGEAFN